jgi:hypothetical protein
LLNPRSLPPKDRSALLNQVASYLEYIAIQFPALERGADCKSLFNMAHFNFLQIGRHDFSEILTGYADQLHAFDALIRPTKTDNKMQPWEWLRFPSGEWRKADALEHHADHCLIGAQDIAWDAAGAIFELELTPDESGRLIEKLSPHSGICQKPAALEFYLICYIAFQIGYGILSSESLTNHEVESLRFADRSNDYATRLAEHLARTY